MSFDRYPKNSNKLSGGTTPGASTDFLTTPITPKAPGGSSILRIGIQVATGSIFKARIASTSPVVAAVDHKLNGGVALTAGCYYTFTMLVSKDWTINFQTTSGVVVDSFVVDEYVGGVS